jgi:hypothetical protein
MRIETATQKVTMPSKRAMALFLSLTFFFLGFFLIIFMAQQSSLRTHLYGISFELISFSLGLVLVIIIGAWVKLNQRFDPFEFPIWLSMNVYIQVIMNVWLLQRDRGSSIPWLINNPSTLTLAVVLFGVSLVMLWTGYILVYRWTDGSKQMPKTKREVVNISHTYLVWFVTWLIGIYVTLAGIGSYLGSGISSNLAWLNYYQFAAVIGSAATATLTILHFKKPSRASWMWSSVVLGSQIILSVIAGSKSFVLLLIWFVMYFYYARRSLPRFWVIVAGMLVILLVPVVNRYRVELHALDSGKGVSLAARVNALADSVAETTSQPLQSSFESTKNTFQVRQGSLLEITASVLALHPDRMPFVGTEMVNEFFPQLIPRVFWPEKPVSLSPLYKITTVYTGAATEYSFSSIGLSADAYRAGGWITVIIFFFLLGGLLAWLYRIGPQSGSLAGTVFYTTLLSNLILYDKDVFGLLVNLAQFGPIIWVTIRLVLFRNVENHNASAHRIINVEQSHD